MQHTDVMERPLLPRTARLETLRAAADTIVPPDDYPGGWDGGVARLLELEGDRPELDGAI